MTNQGTEVIERKTRPLLTLDAIQSQKGQVALLTAMVQDVLKDGMHYQQIPGTQGKSLLDAGANEIMSHFNVYPGERKIIRIEDSTTKIAICIEVPLINRESGFVVATGVGASSTLETKYKYRWIANPKELGYDDEAIKHMKVKKNSNPPLYQIPNPEHGELLNTLVKMASKRGEVDAVEALPGVATALKYLFEGKKPPKTTSEIAQEQPAETTTESSSEADQHIDWTKFWSTVRQLGFIDSEARQICGVESFKAYFESGHNPEEVYEILLNYKPPDKK